jgi:hypothetical protein
MSPLNYLRTQWKHTFWWLFLGISASIGIQGLLESEFENEILQTLSDNITAKTKGMSEVALIDTTIQTCYYLQERKSLIFNNHVFTASKANHFNSSLQSFYTEPVLADITACLPHAFFSIWDINPKLYSSA